MMNVGKAPDPSQQQQQQQAHAFSDGDDVRAPVCVYKLKASIR